MRGPGGRAARQRESHMLRPWTGACLESPRRPEAAQRERAGSGAGAEAGEALAFAWGVGGGGGSAEL